MQEEPELKSDQLPRPRNFEITFVDGYKKITRSWYSTVLFVPLLFIMLVVNGIWISSDSLDILTSDQDLLHKGFALMIIVAGALLVYYAFASYFNRTDILVSRDVIEIKHYPVPWYGNKRLAATDIESLLVEEKYRGSGNYKRNQHFNLLGLTTQGKRLKIMMRFTSGKQAFFIKQEVESYWADKKNEDKPETI